MQAPVFFCCGINGDPYANNSGANGIIEIGAVLVPGFFAANARGFDQSHVLKEYGCVIHQAREDGEDVWIVGEVVESRVVIDKFPDFTHHIASPITCDFGKASAFGGFGHYALKVRVFAIDEVPHGLADRFDLLRRKCPLNGEVSLFVKPGDLTIIDIGEGVEIVCPFGRFI